MARRGREVYVLADSSKLGLRPFHAWAQLALPWTLVTDDDADPGQVQKFQDAGVSVRWPLSKDEPVRGGLPSGRILPPLESAGCNAPVTPFAV
jgi:hypothetical protein